MRRIGAGVCKHRGGGEHRGREDRFASRSGRPPAGNRIGFGFPAPPRSGPAPRFRQDCRMDRWRKRRAACGGVRGAAPPKQTKNRAAGCRWVPRSKRERLCVPAGLCVSFRHGAWRRFDPVSPSLVRAKAGSGDAPGGGGAARTRRRSRRGGGGGGRSPGAGAERPAAGAGRPG